MACGSCGNSSIKVSREAQKEMRIGKVIETKDGKYEVKKMENGKVQAIKIP